MQNCTVNPSTALEPSDSGEFAFTYTCNRPIPPLQLSCVHDTGIPASGPSACSNAINYGRDPATGAERKKIIKGPHNQRIKDPDFCRKMVGTNVGLNGGKVMFAVAQKRGMNGLGFGWVDCAVYLDYFPSATAKLQYGQGEGLIAAYRAWIEHEGCDPEGGTTVTTTPATTTPATTTTTMAATVPARRRRRRGSARRRRGRKQARRRRDRKHGDLRPSRRRRSSRRRRRRRRPVSLAELEALFKEVRMRVRSMAL